MKPIFIKAVIFTVFALIAVSCEDMGNQKIPTSTIYGEVYFPNGNLCQGAFVQLRKINDNGSYTPTQATITNQNGKYELVAETNSGNYRIYSAVSYTNGESYSGEFSFWLVAGKRQEVNLIIFKN